MKLKQSTLLAIYGVILLVIPYILKSLADFGALSYFNQLHQLNWYFQYLNLLSLLGSVLLLPFFITLYKSQK